MGEREGAVIPLNSLRGYTATRLGVHNRFAVCYQSIMTSMKGHIKYLPSRGVVVVWRGPWPAVIPNGMAYGPRTEVQASSASA